MKNGQTRVVVTGMGTVNPLGKDLEEYWHGLIEGRSGASPVERFPTDRRATKFACQVNSFDPQDYIERKAAQRTARFSQMAVAASRMALADSGLDLAKEDDFRVGVAMGTGIGAFDDMTQGAALFLSKGRLNPLYAPTIIPNMAGASVAMQFHLRGPNTTVTTACAASTQTLGDATRMIQHGDADVMLAGGTEASLCEVGLASFNAIRALSTRNDAPETKALKIALGEHARKVAISSTKSMIGHLLGTAGAVEAIATLLTINRGIIHPTINYENADPDCDLDYVPNQARRHDVRIAISNGFGFGGHNAVVVLARYEE